MRHILHDARDLLSQTARKYMADEVERMGAALAFYAVFSMVPVLVLAVELASFVYGREATTGQLQAELRLLVGESAAEVISSAIVHASAPGGGVEAAVVGTLVLLLGASGAFIELQSAMNKVWDCTPTHANGWIAFLERRLLSFAMVVGLGVLLVLSTVLTTVVRAASAWAENYVALSETLLHALTLGTTFLTTAPLFVMIYKWLPDTRIAWSDVAVGAVVTSLLTGVGQLAIGLYLGHSPIVSAYGAAGSLLVVLVWVYATAQLLLIGAEFTQVWSSTRGSRAARRAALRANTRTDP